MLGLVGRRPLGWTQLPSHIRPPFDEGVDLASRIDSARLGNLGPILLLDAPRRTATRSHDRILITPKGSVASDGQGVMTAAAQAIAVC